MNRIGLSRGSQWTATGTLAAIGISVAVFAAGCQSMNDGARQVGLSAQELGRRMSAPFKRNTPSTPSFEREPQGQRDPFLPPPRRPEDDEVSVLAPKRIETVVLGKPSSLSTPALRFASE